jgi:hypothetical protein
MQYYLNSVDHGPVLLLVCLLCVEWCSRGTFRKYLGLIVPLITAIVWLVGLVLPLVVGGLLSLLIVSVLLITGINLALKDSRAPRMILLNRILCYGVLALCSYQVYNYHRLLTLDEHIQFPSAGAAQRQNVPSTIYR